MNVRASRSSGSTRRLLADLVIVTTGVRVAQGRTTHPRDRQTIEARAGEYRNLSQLSQQERWSYSQRPDWPRSR
jgi:hypothetical protein